jgi:long-chain acyl-CoA synthetase
MGVPGAAQGAAMPRFTNLGDLIRRDRDLGKIAIIDLGGKLAREVSYGRLDAMANGVARARCARGLARGERVAIL